MSFQANCFREKGNFVWLFPFSQDQLLPAEVDGQYWPKILPNRSKALRLTGLLKRSPPQGSRLLFNDRGLLRKGMLVPRAVV